MLIMVFKVMEQLTRSSLGVPSELCEQFYSYAHYFVVEYPTPPTEALFVQVVILMVRVAICESPLAARVFLCLLDWLSATTSPMRKCSSELLYQVHNFPSFSRTPLSSFLLFLTFFSDYPTRNCRNCCVLPHRTPQDHRPSARLCAVWCTYCRRC